MQLVIDKVKISVKVNLPPETKLSIPLLYLASRIIKNSFLSGVVALKP